MAKPLIKLLIYLPVSSRPYKMLYVDAKPSIGEKMYLDGNHYIVRDTMHFPLGGQDVPTYQKYNFPFIRVMLDKINF